MKNSKKATCQKCGKKYVIEAIGKIGSKVVYNDDICNECYDNHMKEYKEK